MINIKDVHVDGFIHGWSKVYEGWKQVLAGCLTRAV